MNTKRGVWEPISSVNTWAAFTALKDVGKAIASLAHLPASEIPDHVTDRQFKRFVQRGGRCNDSNLRKENRAKRNWIELLQDKGHGKEWRRSSCFYSICDGGGQIRFLAEWEWACESWRKVMEVEDYQGLCEGSRWITMDWIWGLNHRSINMINHGSLLLDRCSEFCACTRIYFHLIFDFFFNQYNFFILCFSLQLFSLWFRESIISNIFISTKNLWSCYLSLHRLYQFHSSQQLVIANISENSCFIYMSNAFDSLED